MICFYLHPPSLTSLCTLLCALYCPCLWQWNFRQRRVSLQNTIFTHKTLLYSRRLVYWRDEKCRDWKELVSKKFISMELLKKCKSLKTHILKRNEVIDGQGWAQHRQSSLVSKAKNPRHSAPSPASQNLCFSLRNSWGNCSLTGINKWKGSCTCKAIILQ